MLIDALLMIIAGLAILVLVFQPAHSRQQTERRRLRARSADYMRTVGRTHNYSSGGPVQQWDRASYKAR